MGNGKVVTDAVSSSSAVLGINLSRVSKARNSVKLEVPSARVPAVAANTVKTNSVSMVNAVQSTENAADETQPTEIKTFFGVCLTVEEDQYRNEKKQTPTISIAKSDKNGANAKKLHELKDAKIDDKFLKCKTESDNLKYEFFQFNKKCRVFKSNSYYECKQSSCKEKYCRTDIINDFLSEWISLRINRDKTLELIDKPSKNFNQSMTKYNENIVATEKMNYKVYLFILFADNSDYWEITRNGSFRKTTGDKFKKEASENFKNNSKTPIIHGVQQYYILLEQNKNENKFQVSKAYCDGERIA